MNINLIIKSNLFYINSVLNVFFPHAGGALTFLISQKSKQKTIVAAYNLLKIFSFADRKELAPLKQLFCLTAALKDFLIANSMMRPRNKHYASINILYIKTYFFSLDLRFYEPYQVSLRFVKSTPNSTQNAANHDYSISYNND